MIASFPRAFPRIFFFFFAGRISLEKESKLASEQLQVGLDEGLGCGEAGLVLAFPRIFAARCRSGSAFALSPITS
jgi:hypothetical protein